MLFNRCCCNQRPMLMQAQNMMNNCGCGPIVEPTTTKCIEQDFYHEVKQE